MKINEVVTTLENLKKRHGNLDVKCTVPRICWSSGACLGTCTGDVTTIIPSSSGKCVFIDGKKCEE